MTRRLAPWLALVAVLLAAPSAGAQTPVAGAAAADKDKEPPPGKGALSLPNADPFPSTYRPVRVAADA